MENKYEVHEKDDFHVCDKKFQTSILDKNDYKSTRQQPLSQFWKQGNSIFGIRVLSEEQRWLSDSVLRKDSWGAG